MSSSSSSSIKYVNAMTKEHENDASVSTSASNKKPAKPVQKRMIEFNNQLAYLVTPDDNNDNNNDLHQDKKNDNHGSSSTFTVLVIHEWWGLNDQIKSMADQFVGHFNCIALAVDVYQTTTAPATEPRDARKLMKQALLQKSHTMQRLQDACTFLEHTYPNLKRGVVGWCFGGMLSLELSLLYPMDATILYYGLLETNGLETLHGPVLGIFGALDKSISVDPMVRMFETSLIQAKKEYEICIYEDANHAFANPSSKLYNAKAADAAWEKVMQFIQRFLM